MSTTSGEEADNTSILSCSPYDSQQYAIVAVVSVVSAAVSFLACVFVILLIVLFKRYMFFTWRLVLYLTIAACVRALAISIHRIDFNSEQQSSKYCAFAGFFALYTSWSELLAVVCMSCNIFINAVLNKRTEKLERVYVIAIIFLPVLISWVPFIEGGYGSTGPWCWLRSFNEDCSTFSLGVFNVFFIWFGPLYAILIVLTVTYSAILCQFARTKGKWSGQYDPHLEHIKAQLTKEVKPLIWYPIIYILINILPFVTHILRVAVPQSPVLVLWGLTAAVFPLPGAMVSLAFTLTPETRKTLRWRELRAAGRGCCHKTKMAELAVSAEGRETSFVTHKYTGIREA